MTPGVKIDCQIVIDFVYVKGAISCNAKVLPHGYRIQKWATRDAQGIYDAIKYVVNAARAGKGVASVKEICIDREAGVGAVSDLLTANLGIILKQSIPYRHQRVIERDIRTIRNVQRACLESVRRAEIPITMSLVLDAWEYATKIVNFTPNVNTNGFLPYQIQYGTTHYWTPPEFGKFVIIDMPRPADKVELRRQIAMVIGFEENTNAIWVKTKGNSRPIVRSRFSDTDQEQARKYFYEGTDLDPEYLSDDDEGLDDHILSSAEWNELLQDEQTHKAIMELMTDNSESSEDEDDQVVFDSESIGSLDLPIQAEEQLPVGTLGRSGRIHRPNLRYTGSEWVMMLKRKADNIRKIEQNTLSLLEKAMEDAKNPSDEGRLAAIQVELLNVWKIKKAFEPVRLPDDVPGGPDAEFEIIQ